MKMGVKLRGFRELDKALSELPRATAKNVLRKVGKAALEPMADQAAALAPERSGKLAFSIAISERGTRRAVWKKKKPHEFVMAMGPASGLGTLQYAAFDEFGTVDTPALPFMRPAWDGGKHQALETVKDMLWVEIRKAAERGAKRAAKAKAR